VLIKQIFIKLATSKENDLKTNGQTKVGSRNYNFINMRFDLTPTSISTTIPSNMCVAISHGRSAATSFVELFTKVCFLVSS